jgi:hypothetical protein
LSEVRAFFEAYGEAFTKGPAAIAAFYAEPCIIARGGVVSAHAGRLDVEKYFRAAGDGSRGAILFLIEQSAGKNSAIATVQWAHRDARGKAAGESTSSYNLYRFGGEWKILLQTMHDHGA